ncbi:MAG TPA: hypothetical protein VFL38_15145 [Humibacillus xanthopallidus]|nr:hypothetical protein [Humibacillus xanthopallidus]
MVATAPGRDELPEVVQRVTAAHAELLGQRLPGLLEGLHLHGSIGFGGEFFAGSDVDFVAVVSRRPTEDEIEALRQVHAELDRRWPEPAYDGFYLLESDLAGRPQDVPEGPGVLHQWFDVGTHADVTDITWRELRDHGITLCGKDLRHLEIWSDDVALHRATRENLDGYWRMQLEAMHHHPREASLPQAAEWGGLGAPRLVHLLVTGHPTSKSGAGRWAIEAYPQHRELVDEALRVRERPDDSSTYAAEPDRRRRDLIALMTEVIADGVALTDLPADGARLP